MPGAALTILLCVRQATRPARTVLREPSNLTSALSEAAQTIFKRSLTLDLLPVHLLGVGASRLSWETALHRDLFYGDARKRQGVLDRTVDAIRRQFGAAAVRGAVRWIGQTRTKREAAGDKWVDARRRIYGGSSLCLKRRTIAIQACAPTGVHASSSIGSSEFAP